MSSDWYTKPVCRRCVALENPAAIFLCASRSYDTEEFKDRSRRQTDFITRKGVTEKVDSCLVYNKNLVVNIDGKVVRLDDNVVLRVRVFGHGHCLAGRRIGLVFFNFLYRRGKG